MKFSACIDMMFADCDFAERIRLAKKNGVDAIEFWKWSDKDLDLIKKVAVQEGLEICLMNVDSSDESLSHDLSRGILSHNRKHDLKRAISETSRAMEKLGVKNKKAIVLAGDVDPKISLENALENAGECLASAMEAARSEGMTLVLEPLNTFDRQTYVMPYSHQGLDIVKKVGSPHLRLLLDLYHTQRMEGNLIDTIEKNIDFIGHFHIANSPRRCEPDLGEINYSTLLCAIEKLDYCHYCGFEYRIKNPQFDLGNYISRLRESGTVK